LAGRIPFAGATVLQGVDYGKARLVPGQLQQLGDGSPVARRGADAEQLLRVGGESGDTEPGRGVQVEDFPGQLDLFRVQLDGVDFVELRRLGFCVQEEEVDGFMGFLASPIGSRVRRSRAPSRRKRRPVPPMSRRWPSTATRLCSSMPAAISFA